MYTSTDGSSEGPTSENVAGEENESDDVEAVDVPEGWSYRFAKAQEEVAKSHEGTQEEQSRKEAAERRHRSLEAANVKERELKEESFDGWKL